MLTCACVYVSKIPTMDHTMLRDYPMNTDLTAKQLREDCRGRLVDDGKLLVGTHVYHPNEKVWSPNFVRSLYFRPPHQPSQSHQTDITAYFPVRRNP